MFGIIIITTENGCVGTTITIKIGQVGELSLCVNNQINSILVGKKIGVKFKWKRVFLKFFLQTQRYFLNFSIVKNIFELFQKFKYFLPRQLKDIYRYILCILS